PGNLGEILTSYDRVVCPEMNLGQLAMLLRSRYLVDVQSHTKVAGVPFQAEELEEGFTDLISATVKEAALRQPRTPDSRNSGAWTMCPRQRSPRRPRTSSPTRRCGGVPAAATMSCSTPSSRSCLSSASSVRTSFSCPGSAAPHGSPTT